MPGRQPHDEDDDALKSFDDNPRTFPREGWGEEVDPAVSVEEWTDSHSDQLDEAADVDDPVEAIEGSVLWAGTEAEASGDSTELADRAAPLPPEEAALIERAGISPEADELTTGLPAGSDLDAAAPEELLEAELTAISEGDPELAATFADELARRKGPQSKRSP
jgi:hypothetical protein